MDPYLWGSLAIVMTEIVCIAGTLVWVWRGNPVTDLIWILLVSLPGWAVVLAGLWFLTHE